MINLLPPDTRSGYRFASRNVGLRRWMLMCALALVGLGALATYGLLTIQESTSNYNKQIAGTQAQFKNENFSGTQQQVRDISNSFKLVVKVLSNEVLFSQMLKQIGTIVPSNVNLTGLTIAQGTAGVDISAEATDYNAATQLQVNLADPSNKIFSKADIVSITCGGTAATDPNYPCMVTIRALFASKNPFLFINNSGATP